MWRDRRPWLLAAPALALVLFFFAIPVAQLARVSLCIGGGSSGFGIGGGGFYQPGTWTLATWKGMLGDEYFREVLTFTVELGLGVAAITVLFAYPLALFIRSLSPLWRSFALCLVLLPKIANLLVVVYGLELLLGNEGPVNRILVGSGIVAEPLTLFHNLTGTVIGKTYLVIPYAILVLVASLARLDPALPIAARGLGASPWRAFWTITFPLSVPGLALAGLISLIWALGAFVSPYLLGSPDQITLAVDVQRQTFENVNWPRGAADAVAMLLTVGITLLLYRIPAGLARRAAGAA